MKQRRLLSALCAQISKTHRSAVFNKPLESYSCKLQPAGLLFIATYPLLYDDADLVKKTRPGRPEQELIAQRPLKIKPAREVFCQGKFPHP